MKDRCPFRIAAVAALLACSATASANDICSAATVVECGDIFAGTTLGATPDGMPTCVTTNTANGVWFRLAGDGDEVTLSTCHPSTTYDTKLGVWSGTCDALSCVTGNDDVFDCPLGSFRSEVTFQTIAGVDYFILVHGFSANAGDYGLVVSCAAPPPPLANDNCADAIVMSEAVDYTGDNRGSTVDGSASCGAPAPDVWYTFAPAATATAQFSLCDSAYDTVLSVYDGCPGAGGTEIACNDDACGFGSQVSLAATAGETYWVRVSGDGTSGQFSLRADLFAPDVNDNCAGALPLSEGAVATGDTRGNTPEGGLPSCALSLAPDVWYSFQSAVERTARFSMCASTFDTVLSVYDGCPGAGGTEVACNDNLCGAQSEVVTDLLADHTYYLRVTGDGADGEYALQATTFEPGSFGPDVTLMDIRSTIHYGDLSGVHGYALGSHTCNIGNQNMIWDGGTGSPWLAMNAYRISDGRLEQIGMSWCKNACCAAAGNGCGPACNGVGGQQLGVGCLDVYGAGFNGGHFGLGPRSGINAFTGAIAYNNSDSGDAIFKRLQIPRTDMQTSNHPDARFFVEGLYVGIDDAPAGNAMNNATYRPVTINQSTFDMSLTGVAASTIPAIFAWRDHGLGAGMPDNAVTIVEADVPGEGRFYLGAKVTDNGDGTWRYDYAVYNYNSDLSGGSFTVPIPAGTTVTNIGFHDVDYHSGEPYDNTDWSATQTADHVAWSSPETFAQNANSNALRWGTMYNFWFTADQPPADGSVNVGLFKPGAVSGVAATVAVPTAAACLCDLDGAAGVDVFDLLAYLDLWFDNAAAADIDGAAGVDVFDLLAFLDCWFPASSGSCV